MNFNTPYSNTPITASVLYRLPNSKHFTRIVQHGMPKCYTTLNDVPLSGGYVVMPFVVTNSQPIVFVTPDSISREMLPTPQASMPHSIEQCNASDERATYTQAFAKCKQMLLQGQLQQVVLSRRLQVKSQQPWSAEKLFVQACHNRPNSFIALWTTPQTGTWLVATPEPLLQKQGNNYSTVALAGTLPYDATCATPPLWDEKNRQEQALVAHFIESQIRPISQSLLYSDCHTIRSGNIQHLCTNFSFKLNNSSNERLLLQCLHPTPAVCGLPQAEALRAIIESESTPRQYYAGFSGPFHLAKDETQLFVSLRCMHLQPNCATLYAGGGIMPESKEQAEWDETCRKLQTMLDVLRG